MAKTFEDRFETKKLLAKLTILGIGIDVIYRVSIWVGLDEKIKELVSELKN